MDQDDPEEHIADLERRVAEPDAVGWETEVSRSRQRTTRVVLRTLRGLALLGLVLFAAGAILTGTGMLTWIGLAMVGGCAVLLFPIRRRAEKDRWHEGTITLRTVEPGPVGESGQRVDCEVALNPTGRITRAYTIAGPLDTSWLVVDATLRCLIDRYEFIVVRAFPYAQPDASLPSGRELKFSRAKART